ncbi:serine/threonine protein kinase [Candidatus Uabimicrobium amorphum]|uniref:non-specific serine/threonine protein kinase n=1 Tax=Uabimicrobium amorphum TaxID=2596890 RepID=A0A5S9ILU2_UABAM|nr:serine/threonine-protein kinase [Candidatus Uabimicrobium amorphum]BBM82945.1 protein kinase [Candidatus Uabimicrobium amorphum]
MSSEMLTFQCTNCPNRVHIKKSANPLGKALKCKQCGNIFHLRRDNLCRTPSLLQFTCPKCKRQIPVRGGKEVYGKRLPCRACNHVFVLQDPNNKTSPLKRATKQMKPKKQEVKTSFGHYSPLEFVGRGGMGEVYKVYEPRLSTHLALKILPRALDGMQEKQQRFLREAKLAMQLTHPNIVKVYDIGKLEDQHYFTMEFIDGLELHTIIKNKQLPMKSLLQIFVKLCYAMQHAHEKNMIHRDLKPENIMVNRQGQPKIMDFGLAKPTDDTQRLTAAGVIVGTITHMSPEQAMGQSEELDHRTDIYSLGVILYNMLTYELPFRPGPVYQMLKQVIEIPPIPPNEINESVSQKLSDVCMKALAKKKQQRYQKVENLGKAVEKIMG